MSTRGKKPPTTVDTARDVVNASSMASAAHVIVTTPAELDALVRRAVREELASIAPHADSEWLTADQCAAFLDVTRETVVTYARREGGLPCRYTGRSPVFKRAEVVAWLERRRESPSARSTRRGAQLRRIDGGR